MKQIVKSRLLIAVRNIFILVLLSSTYISFGINNQLDTSFYYTIKPIIKKDRTELEVSLHFKVNVDTPINMTIFRDFYGTPNLYRYLVNLKALNGTVINETKVPESRILVPNAAHEVSLKYTISYDPADFIGASYAPNISKDYFHVAACQWMLIIGSLTTPHKYHINVIDPPKNWNFYCSASADPFNTELNGSYQRLFNRYWGGGSQPVKKLQIEGRELKVFISEKIQLPVNQVLEAVSKIVTAERQLFKDFDFPFYTVTILPREDNVAGLRVKNMFICYVQEDVTLRQLYQLIAHEMFHEWMGGKINIISPDTDPVFKHHWFTEGFTDYFANKTLLNLKIQSYDEFANAINRYIINIADNKYKSYTATELIKLSEEGKYGTPATKLQYYRGALMALNVERDLKLLAPKISLLDLIVRLYDSTANYRNGITEDHLFDFFKRNYADLQTGYENNIVKGNQINNYDDALGEQYHLKDSLVNSFNLGFSLNDTYKTNKITGLELGSEAEKAGLDEGMEFVNIENYNRFSNNWRYDKPAVVVVKVDGVEKRIKYNPKGKEFSVKLFVLKN